MVGLAEDEFLAAKRWNTTGLLAVLSRRNPLLITDITRRSILQDAAVCGEVDARATSEGSSTGCLFNDATSWRAARRILRGSSVVVQMGANPARETAAILPGRVPHGRRLTLSAEKQAIVFEPGKESSWRVEDATLRVSLTPDQALELSQRLSRGACQFTVPGLKGVRFNIVVSRIRDPAGKVVKEVP